jgi:predicted urease superfamily metal-dependent hydrolase
MMFCHGILEFAADVAGVAVGEVGAPHHPGAGDTFDRKRI